MANRQLLHKNKLDLFKEWLILNGWYIENTKGLYEVLRATNKTKLLPLIIYEKNNSKEHYSIMDKDSSIIKSFIKECKVNKL